jgi:hypothetical protein
MKNLSRKECIEICKLINPNLMWEWNDHFDMDDPPFYAVNGTGNSGELYMLKFYYSNDKITLIDGNSENFDEKNIDFQSNNEILKIMGVELDANLSNFSDESHKLIFKKYVEKITDKFSTTVEYRMSDSIILRDFEGYGELDLNVRVFVENNDFVNSKIILAITYYAPEPGTGTILHESVADVMIDNKDVFKLDNEYSYSGLDVYGFNGSKLDICNINLAKKSSRIEQIQFHIDLATLIKFVNAQTIEIRVNKKENIGGLIENEQIINLIGFYNGIFDPKFKKDDLLKHESNLLEEKEKRRIKFESQITTPDPNYKLNQEKNATGDSNCFIITATMNDPYHPIVDEFRAYRDSKLLTNIVGKAFVSIYYIVGPFAAFLISKSSILRKLSFRLFVNPVYKRIKND